MASVEALDKYNVKMTINISAEDFEKGLRYSYNKNRSYFNIQGFRKGRAPRKLIERQFGENVFYEDAINFALPGAYESAVKEENLNVVSKPSFNIVSTSLGEGVVAEAQFAVVGEASVDEYYALPYKKYDTEPTDDEIQAAINIDRDKNARILTVVRPVAQGDIVTIDFNGVIDGEPFEGGKAEDYKLTIGEHSFVDTFEDQLVGAETGENIFVRVTFPEDYNYKEFAGKRAVFDVKIKEIQEKELPGLDDDFAQDVSEFDTFDAYREDLIKKLKESKEHEAEHSKEDQVITGLVGKTVVDLPPVMIEERIDEMIRNFENQLQYQRMTLDMYYQVTGQTEGQLRESRREPAIMQLKANLALEAIAKKENLKASDEEIEAETKMRAAIYGWQGGGSRPVVPPEIVAKDLANKKAYEFVMGRAIEIA